MYVSLYHTLSLEMCQEEIVWPYQLNVHKIQINSCIIMNSRWNFRMLQIMIFEMCVACYLVLNFWKNFIN